MSLDDFQEQAKLVFLQCDQNNKGYLVKDDLQVIQQYLPLAEQQLAELFSSLDKDGNGKLTLNEFINGFAEFLNNQDSSVDSTYSNSKSRDFLYGQPEGIEDSFKETIEQTGVAEVIDDIDLVKEVWAQVQKENPALLPDFEKLLARVSKELKKSRSDYQNIEYMMRNRITAHDEEIRNMYEEMEQQIRLERNRLIEQKKLEERQIKEELENEIVEKDKIYQEILKQHEETAARLRDLQQIHVETAQEKEKLAQERDMLEARLTDSNSNLEECQEYIEVLKIKAKEDKRQRAKAAIDMSESLALERESLVRQLEQLREMNRLLKDERDEKLINSNRSCRRDTLYGETINIEERSTVSGATEEARIHPTQSSSLLLATPNTNNRLQLTSSIDRRGSTLAAYFGPNHGSRRQTVDLEGEYLSEMDEMEESYSPVFQSSTDNSPRVSIDKNGGTTFKQDVESRYSPDGATANRRLSSSCKAPMTGAVVSKTPRQSVVASSVFKVVFVGDSDVGKSTLIHHYTKGEYCSALPTTVGVDFQIKSVEFDQTKAVLQLWDTAGQEKFRSITKQYFRKADGVVVVFDVTNSESYLHVRNWMECLAEGAPDNCAVMLLANKIDRLAEERPADETANKVYISEEQGSKMSKQYDALFFAVSAKTGANVNLCFQELARTMKKSEQLELKNSVNLQSPSNLQSLGKTSCCSK